MGVEGRVWDSNVRTAVELIGMVVGYAVDESDTQAVLLGVAGSDADEDRWYTYPLVGDPIVEVHLASNPGGHPVDVRVTGAMSEVQQARIDTILTCLAIVRDST